MQEVKIPKRGMTNTPILVAKWIVKEGEYVKSGSEIVSIEAEKIHYTISAEISGYVHIVVNEGQEVPIGTVIGFIIETQEEYKKISNKVAKEDISFISSSKKDTEEMEITQKRDLTTHEFSSELTGRVRITPAARMMAKKYGIDLESVKGTGSDGIITKEDIEKILQDKDKPKYIQDLYDGRRVKEEIPLSKMRKQIAEHMVRSLSVSAQLTLMGEMDMMEMKKIRELLLIQEKNLGVRITYTDLFIYLVAKQLVKHPLINSSLINDKIIIWDNVNIGVATALENGLIVPVIKDADKKTLKSISIELKDLTKKAREEKLQLEEVTGGTFTITNLGSFSGAGYRFETPIINQPESAILGTGGISDRVVVREGRIVIRPILTYYFTYDHRVIDGLTAAKFIEDLQKAFEQPNLFIKVDNLEEIIPQNYLHNHRFNR